MSYWEDRGLQILTENERSSNAFLNQINAIYEETSRDTAQQIKSLLDRYSEGLTPDEVKAFLNEKIPMSEYNRLVSTAKTLPDGTVKTKLLKRLEGQAVEYRIIRKQAIQDNILTSFARAAQVQNVGSHNLYKDVVKNSYYQSIFGVQQALGVGFGFDMIPEKVINSLLGGKFYGKNFSSRVWDNTEELAKQAYDRIAQGMLQGQSIDDMAKNLTQFSKHKSMMDATRLVRTEVNHFSNQGAKRAYEECDIEKYQFLATLDRRTSDMCARLDMKPFLLEDAETGVNYPPMHPYCRSCTIPVIDDDVEESLGQRIARDENGKNIKVTGDMRYGEWKKKFVDGIGETVNSSTGGKFIAIINTAINIVPNVEIEGFTTKENLFIQSEHKRLLQYAKDHNNSNEVAFVLSSDLSQSASQKGDRTMLTFSNSAKIMLNSSDGLFVMHNHPSNSSFSVLDIRFLLDTDSVKSFSIVKNNGRVEILTKNNNYDKVKATNEFKRAYKNTITTGSDREFDKLVATFIKKYKGVTFYD